MRCCPICSSDGTTPYVFPPYVTCTHCLHTYQPEWQPKVWLNPEVGDCNGYAGAEMGPNEKSANKFLAAWLWRFQPRCVLDVGAGYPFLASCFADFGAQVSAIDGAYAHNLVNCGDLSDKISLLPYDWEDPNFDVSAVLTPRDLITMVHVLEHFNNPVLALQRASDCLTQDGVLFVRSPNADVSGIVRDHTPGHAAIHPNIFSTESLKFLAAKVGLHLLWYEHAPNFGQTSWLFRKRPPRISLTMIVKNEGKNIEPCLELVQPFCDEVIILDTGSTDDTVAKATAMGAKVVLSERFNKDTNSEEFEYATARNEALSYATGDWILWMDADDRFHHVRGGLNLDPTVDAYEILVHYGNLRLKHSRLFRNHWGVKFIGDIHEVPNVRQCRSATYQLGYVEHLTDAKPQRIGRNIGILEREFQDKPTCKRTMFYLANAYREAGRLDEAVSLYERYVVQGGNFRDEISLAYFYWANCLYRQRQYDAAIRVARKGLDHDDRWAEIWDLIGECYYLKGEYAKAIGPLTTASLMTPPQTSMFVQTEMYGPVPKWWLSYCYEKLGDIDKAKQLALESGNEKRIQELVNRIYTIEVIRPGANGDVLATTPAVHELRRQFPDAWIRYVTNCKEVLLHNPDINEVVETQGKPCDRRILFQYPMHEGYPNTPMYSHLAEYFAKNAGVDLPIDWKNVLDLSHDTWVKLDYDKPAIAFAVKTGWSKYKEWPLERWEELIKRFPDCQFVQLGGEGEPAVPGAHYTCGKLTLRESFTILKQCALFVGLDSVFNHACNALDVPAVILFGSTSPQGSGYAQATNLWSAYECSPCYRENNSIAVHKKAACPFNHKCMNSFMSVDLVEQVVRVRLEQSLQI